LAIGHFAYQKQKYLTDLVKAWSPPFNPSEVVCEIKDILSEYRIHRITGDKYAANWVTEAFEKHGVNYQPCSKSKSDLYLDFEGYLNTSQIEYQNDKQLITELSNLERRRGKRGRDTVDHPPRGSDDLANSVAGICHVLTSLENSAFAGCDLS
jgi:hypothetical protein